MAASVTTQSKDATKGKDAAPAPAPSPSSAVSAATDELKLGDRAQLDDEQMRSAAAVRREVEDKALDLQKVAETQTKSAEGQTSTSVTLAAAVHSGRVADDAYALIDANPNLTPEEKGRIKGYVGYSVRGKTEAVLAGTTEAGAPADDKARTKSPGASGRPSQPFADAGADVSQDDGVSIGAADTPTRTIAKRGTPLRSSTPNDTNLNQPTGVRFDDGSMVALQSENAGAAREQRDEV